MLCCSVVNDVHSVSDGGLKCLSQHRHYWQKKKFPYVEISAHLRSVLLLMSTYSL